MSVAGADIRQFLTDKLGLDVSGIGDDTPLFSSELLDSFSMVELLVFLEQTAGIRFSPSDVRLENLDTIAAMLRFVQAARDG